MTQLALPSYLKGKKASVVFIEYIDPFLNEVTIDRLKNGLEQPGVEQLESYTKIPWTIWNIVVSDSFTKNKEDNIKYFKNTLSKTAPKEAQKLLDLMFARKQKDFSEYKYYLGQYKFWQDNNDELRFKIDSTPAKAAFDVKLSELI